MGKKQTLKKMKKYSAIYVLLIPVILYFLIFSYYPLILGIISSFQNITLLGDRTFVGLENYKTIFADPLFYQSLENTLIVNIGISIVKFITALIIALGINELRNKFAKTAVQTMSYLPQMLSWSVVGGIFIELLSPTGLVNSFLQLVLGSSYTPIVFMAQSDLARKIMILTASWKDAGYFAVLFLAAIVSIDQAMYEAAVIDGASRLKQIIYVTIPNLVPTMKVVALLCAVGVMGNFDQIYVMSNSAIADKVRNMLLLIYQQGIASSKTGYATACATVILLITFIVGFAVRKLTKYDNNYSE